MIRPSTLLTTFGALLIFLAGCAVEPERAPTSGESRPAPELEAPAPAESGRPLIIFLGDSLTAGMGLEAAEAFPAVTQERLASMGIPVRVLNAGISGDTTAGGLSRIGWLLRQEPDIVVLALGANDGLRGLPLEMSERNLRSIITQVLDSGAGLLLAGMLIPPSYGPEYSGDFQAIFPRLAGELDIAFLPFLLENVAAIPELNQEDGIHPNARGQELIADNILPYLVPMIEARSGE